VRGLRRRADDQPTVFLAYTVKGWGTPLAGTRTTTRAHDARRRWPSFRLPWACRRDRSGSPSQAWRIRQASARPSSPEVLSFQGRVAPAGGARAADAWRPSS
jgi:pyruvate dehydrogenase complex dehydrogenase (E1) component